ncbi:lipoprotein-releasing ABC transporter permease subunit [Taklimakanibacter deserti]|uniref:lipoprotein-releasing ABC transporter permease subunit n=1 Tax=Taklimakanibacter deserti TaxID=2267839 RepID=UPI000E649C62
MDKALPDTKPFAPFERMLALRYLLTRRREGFVSVISLISFLGIMLGVATLIVVMAVLNGFRAELLDKILGFSGHATFYSLDAAPITDYENDTARIARVPGVVHAMPFVEGQAMASTQRNNTGALVRGVHEADLKKLPSINNQNLTTALKELGTPDEVPSLDGFENSGGVAIGERMAWKHGLGLGSTLTIISPAGPETVMGTAPRIRDYPVVAIFKIGMSEYDESVIYMPLAEAQDYFVVDNAASAIEVTVDNPDMISEMKPALLDAAGPSLDIQTWQQRNQAFFGALAVERNVMFLVLTMIILVAALNIISGLYMLVKDKGHDIAILRTMGATSGSVQRIFFMTGAIIGVVGTLAGFLLGLVICLNVDGIRRFVTWLSGTEVFSPELYYLSQLPAKIEPVQTASIVLMSLALSFLATLYPAWRAARLDPVEALRYE